ncbi:MAG: DNA alkylation repair protein [Candidatus Omnitrophica bacterium]|nr:DNA alkylation repair protein [Candidatus Omnitrophota bacterium]
MHLCKVLASHASPAKAEMLKKFFKTGKGQYAHGEQFLGIPVPILRRILKPFSSLAFNHIDTLLKSPVHEQRLSAVLILVGQFKTGDDQKRSKVYKFYLKNAHRINNWNLVDCSAHHIVGAHLSGKDKAVLERLAASEVLWERRIAMVATWHDIQKGRREPALTIARLLLADEHDLMRKAVGWMLREVGKRVSVSVLQDFLKQHHQAMSRTTLRCAIEHFPPQQRRTFLKGECP